MKAFIFDMDGVLIDTEPIHGKLIADILKEYSVTIDPASLEKYSGMTSTDVSKILIQKYNLPITPSELANKHMVSFREYAKTHELDPIEGIIDLLDNLKKKNIPLAIASSSPMPTIKLIAKQLHIENYFMFYISGEDLKHSKPAPDIYLKAAEILNVLPKDCIVLEDSTHGATAAARAGMYCIGFNRNNIGKQDLSIANEIVTTTKQIDLEKL